MEVEVLAMKPFLVLYGLIGLGIAGLLARNYYVILKHLVSHKDISMTMFFLSDDSGPAFRVLAYATLMYALVAPLAGIGAVFGPDIDIIGVTVYEASVETVSLLALLATLFWQKKVSDLTEKPSEKESTE